MKYRKTRFQRWLCLRSWSASRSQLARSFQQLIISPAALGSLELKHDRSRSQAQLAVYACASSGLQMGIELQELLNASPKGISWRVKCCQCRSRLEDQREERYRSSGRDLSFEVEEQAKKVPRISTVVCWTETITRYVPAGWGLLVDHCEQRSSRPCHSTRPR